jgi:hypothetical protein
MGQLIHTKQFGTLEVEQSFHEPPYHVAKCTNGAWVHISGLPVKNEGELRKAVPVQFLEEALDWFRHRHEREEAAPLRVIVNPDGSCEFEDGSPIENTSQLTQALKPGPMLDAALLWFTKKKIAEEEAETDLNKNKKTGATKKAADKKSAKKPAAKKAPPRKSSARPPAPGPAAGETAVVTG